MYMTAIDRDRDFSRFASDDLPVLTRNARLGRTAGDIRAALAGMGYAVSLIEEEAGTVYATASREDNTVSLAVAAATGAIISFSRRYG